MRRHPLSSFALVLALACSPTEPKQSADEASTAAPAEDPAVQLEAAAAAAFAGALTSVGLESHATGPRVLVGEHVLVVDVTTEHAEVHDGQFIHAAAFALSLDGRVMPAFTSGVIGVGRDAADASETALYEWLGQYGAPIAFAVAAREFPERKAMPTGNTGAAAFYIPLRVDGLLWFASPVGLRGGPSVAETLTSDPFVLHLSESIASLVPLDPGYHTLTVQVSVEGSELVDAGCRIDGVDAPELMRIVAALDWPPGDYMYKQFFVLPHGPDVSPAPE
jgi:hypothetical protein